jgi:RNase H-fold protein (predicted Holliday junction resolvase)
VKPRSYLATALNTAKKDTEELTKNDVVVREGTKDVGNNETQKGLHQIKNLVENHNQTNIIVMGITHRYDLLINSCVNNEIKVFNRKLRKQLKAFDNASLIEVHSETDQFTRHGLHLNSKR